MLSLRRKRGEKLILSCPGYKPIIISIGAIEEGVRVKLGIDAPPEIKIIRAELLERAAEQGENHAV